MCVWSKVGRSSIVLTILVPLFLGACTGEGSNTGGTPEATAPPEVSSTPQLSPIREPGSPSPRIASWLAKKDEIVASSAPYSLVMSAWFNPEEAQAIKAANPEAKLLAGLSLNWTLDSPDWMEFLQEVANYGRPDPIPISEDLYLRGPDGKRCPFGWASEEWGQSEIYAMDPRNPKWVDFITSFYKNVLEQPQNDGIIVDMVTEKSWCPDAITDQEWVDATKALMGRIQEINIEGKLVIFNAGRDFFEIDEYAEFMDGYLMENFLGNEFGAGFEEGLKAADDHYLVIYAVDTDNTGTQDLKRMRLGLTLSLLSDNTYLSFDFGSRNHGQAWWFPEYNADLGRPLGDYYVKDGAYWREYENGIVIASPNADITVSLDRDYMDMTGKVIARNFNIEKGDGRILIASTR